MNTPNRAADRAEGERRRDEKLLIVESHRPLEIATAQLRMLEAMRGRDDRHGSSDDMTPPEITYKGNAPWIGAAVRSLAIRNVIERDGWSQSSRPSRHGNEIKSWRLCNDKAADDEIERLRQLVTALTPTSSDAHEKTQRQLALSLGDKSDGRQPAKVTGHE